MKQIVDGITKLADVVLPKSEDVDTKKNGSKKFTKISPWSPMNVFRFSLAGLFVAVKLGLTKSVALAGVSWAVVLLPAYALELVLAALIIIILVFAALYGVVSAIWSAFSMLVLDPIRKKKFTQKMKAAEETGLPSDDPRVDFLIKLKKAAEQQLASKKVDKQTPPGLDFLKGLDK